MRTSAGNLTFLYDDQTDQVASTWAASTVPGEWQPGYHERSPAILLCFVPSLVLSGISWQMGGIQFFNDAAFGLLCLVLAGLFLRELAMFTRRLGLGGLVVFGGGLIWWCYDYGTHWLGFDPNRSDIKVDGSLSLGVNPAILGKALYLHCLFAIFMTAGLFLRRFMFVSRGIMRLPEPYTSFGLFVIVLIVFGVSMIPYVFFTRDDPLTAIVKTISQGYSDKGTEWTAGRTGNVNYSWGGYLAQLVELGYVGGVLAMFHAILFAKSWIQRIICIGIFAIQAALAFGTGARGVIFCLSVYR